MFSPTILEHFRRPRNFGELADADITREVYNPVCGDRIRLMLRTEDHDIAQAAFKGDSCAISKAAASLLTEILTGLRIADAATLPDRTLLDALDAEIPDARLDCALLPLKALREALAQSTAAAAEDGGTDG